MSQESRRSVLDAAADRWCVCGGPRSNCEGDDCAGSEDYTLFLQDLAEGKERLPRWLCVTENGEHVFAHFCETLEGAKYAAEKNIGDDIYPEHPVSIIDLDTGKSRKPAFYKVHYTVGERITP